MTCTAHSLVEALEDLWRAWIRGSIDVSWLSPLKNENVRIDLKPIVVPVRQFYSTPFRSYRRRSMYEAWRRLRLVPARYGAALVTEINRRNKKRERQTSSYPKTTPTAANR